MRLNNFILQGRIMKQQRELWVVVCFQPLRPMVVCESQLLHNAEGDRTLRRLRLDWYWIWMNAELRILLRTCEVFQSAKHGTIANSRQRQCLFSGRLWQVLSIDLVVPFTPTKKGMPLS